MMQNEPDYLPRPVCSIYESGFTVACVGSSNRFNAAISNGLEWKIKVSNVKYVAEAVSMSLRYYYTGIIKDKHNKNNVI